MSAFTVIRESIAIILKSKYQVNFKWYTIIPMGAVVFAKFVLYFYCKRFAQYSPIAKALAEDHFNDVISNSFALLAGMFF